MESAFPSNARPDLDKQRAETKPAKQVKRVTRTKAVQRKKPLGSRVKETFTGGDTKGVFEYVTMDVIVPAVKDMIADAVSTGVERKLFGDVRGSSRSRVTPGRGTGSYTSYNRMNPTAQPTSRREDPRLVGRRARNHLNTEYIVGSRPEANQVLESMYDILAQYEVVSYRDYLDLIGEQAAHTDEKWGWTSLTGATVRRAGDGYVVDLPRPVEID